jgi:hypothetical protein
MISPSRHYATVEKKKSLNTILHCHIYDHERAKLAVQLKTIDESFDLLHLLTRDSNKKKHQKKLTFLEEFIKSTGRFPELSKTCTSILSLSNSILQYKEKLQ